MPLLVFEVIFEGKSEVINMEYLDNDQLKQLATQRYETSRTSLVKNITTDKFDSEFIEIITKSFINSDYFPKEELSLFSIETVINYLEKTHDLYLQKRIPEIGQTIKIMRNDFDSKHPALLLLDIFFSNYARYLSDHINEEEKELFPYIKSLIKIKKLNTPLNLIHLEVGKYSFKDFFKEHTDTEKDIQDVLSAINLYDPSKSNHTPYRILLTQLKMFDIDLRLHARIEEEILLPQAILLKEEILGKFTIKTSQN